MVFVCQNNLYGLSQPWDKNAYQCELVRRVQTYHIPGECVDGMDAVAVYEAACRAVERTRAGGGPSFIEAKTYRLHGHFVGDPGLYMPAEEREAWKQRDSLEIMAGHLRDWGYLNDEEDARMGAGRRSGAGSRRRVRPQQPASGARSGVG